MDFRIECKLRFHGDFRYCEDLINNLLASLHFDPTFIDIYFNLYAESKLDLIFNEDLFLNMINKYPISIKLKTESSTDFGFNDEYLSYDIYENIFETFKTTSEIKWLLKKDNLQYLLSSQVFETLVNSDNLIYCYSNVF
jgi:hypothetical protein